MVLILIIAIMSTLLVFTTYIIENHDKKSDEQNKD